MERCILWQDVNEVEKKGRDPEHIIFRDLRQNVAEKHTQNQKKGEVEIV